MPVPYRSLALANEFICFSPENGVSHMKLQKLVYMAYGWWLTEHAIPVTMDAPEVWRHGPVFSEMYSRLSGFGQAPIKHPVRYFFDDPPPRVDDNDDETSALLQFVWGRYGRMTAFELSDLTHRPGTPWQVTAEKFNYRVPMNHKIETELIKSEFRDIRNREATLF